MPLLARHELVGVLCIESEIPYRFHEEDKTAIELLGGYLAIAIQNMQLRERSEAAADGAAPSSQKSTAAHKSAPAVAPRSASQRREVAYYTRDECILIDGSTSFEAFRRTSCGSCCVAATRKDGLSSPTASSDSTSP